MKLIDIDRRDSVYSLIEALKLSKRKVRVWQSIKETCNYSYGFIEEINPLKRTIKIRFGKPEVINFDENQYIYFHYPHRNLIFKAKIKRAAQGCIEVSLPILVKLQDARAERRTNLGLQSNQYVKVVIMRSSSEKLESKLRVLDLSPSGMALVVSKFIYEGLEADDRIVVKGISADDEDRVYVIRNKRHILNKIGSTQEFRIGLELCR